MTTRNIRNEKDRIALNLQGIKWVTVQPRGDDKGRVLSRHKTHEAAERAARNLERAIVSTDEWKRGE
jgi:hypothetical protein